MTPSHSRTRANGAPVIVGIDGSPGAVHALWWAVAKSETLGPVFPVHVLQQPSGAEIAARFGNEANRAAIRSAAKAHLTEAVDAISPALLDRARVIEGHPGATLCEIAGSAALLVVGTRDRGTAAEGLLGSVAIYCAKHSPVPVAIIPEHVPAHEPIRTVVVGVDGSGHGDRALRWAIDHVADDGLIRAVGALSTASFVNSDLQPPVEVLEKRIQSRVEESVARVTGYPYNGPRIDVHAVAEDARVALRDLAGNEADLLVVGARGVSAIPFLVLGSVSSAVSHHPQVPTVVVHETGGLER